MRQDFSEEIEVIYTELILLEKQRDDIVHAKKLSYSEAFEDAEVKVLESRRQTLLERVRKLQHVQVIQNSFLFAKDNEYWVGKLLDELDK